MTVRVAIVTGANKGIGFAICRGLISKFDGIIYLTSRSKERGQKAVDQLKIENGFVHDRKCTELKYHQLDITDQKSIDNFADFLRTEHGGFDILINNAGIAYKECAVAPFTESIDVTSMQAEPVCRTNFFGTLKVCQALMPLVKPGARIVIVSSTSGMLTLVPDATLRELFASPTLSINRLCELMELFIVKAKEKKHLDHGFPGAAYGMSKVGLTAMTRVLQREIHVPDVVVTACCPGYVDTELTYGQAHLTIDQGAETPIFLATLPPGWNEAKGKFFYDKKEVDWENVDMYDIEGLL